MTFARLWTFFAVALPVVAGLLAILSAVDLAYHVRAGAEFLDTGRIATADTWTHTAAGQPWANQQWGAQVILAAIHRLGGFEALVVFRAAVIGAIFGLVMVAARIRGATARQAALLSLAAFGVSAAALTLRPQLLGMLLFAASLVLVADRRRHPGRLWLVPLLVVAWANLHGSFFLAPLLLGVAWLEDLHDRQPRHGRVLVIAVVAAAAAVLNPLGVGVWTYAIGLSTNAEVTTRISEWQPTTLRSVIGLIFFGSALLVVAFLARRGRPTPWPTLLWLAVLFGIGAYALRGVAWWPLGAAVVVAGLLDRPELQKERPERASRLNAVVAGLVVVAGVILLPWWRPTVLLEAPTGHHRPSSDTGHRRGLPSAVLGVMDRVRRAEREDVRRLPDRAVRSAGLAQLRGDRRGSAGMGGRPCRRGRGRDQRPNERPRRAADRQSGVGSDLRRRRRQGVHSALTPATTLRPDSGH